MNLEEKMIEGDQFASGERLYLGHCNSTTDITAHIERYMFALAHTPATAVVLDAACGSGYGADILSAKASRVIAIELSDHALAFARANCRSEVIEFVRADLNRPLNIDSESVDVVVSLETLEHLDSQDSVLSEFHRVLRPGGKLVLSTPDRDVYSGGSHTHNPFHVHELNKTEFVSLIRRHFNLVQLFGQGAYETTFMRIASLARRMDRWDLRLRVLKHIANTDFGRRSVLKSGLHELRSDGANRRYAYLIALASRSR